MRAIKYDNVILMSVIVALFLSVFNTYRLLPGFGLYEGLLIGFVLSLGGAIGFLRLDNIILPKSMITWVLLSLLIIIQPFINSIDYPDYLIFPFGTLVLASLLAIAIHNLTDKQRFLHHFLYCFLGFMLLSVLIECLQLRQISWRIGTWTIIEESPKRIYANFLQPNQAAFMLVLASLSSLFFYEKKQKNMYLLFCAVLSFGVALTLSRAGLLMLIASVVFFYIFLDKEWKNSLISSLRTFLCIFVSYYVGSLAYKTFNTFSAESTLSSTSAVERFSEGSLFMRVAMQESAWITFQESLLTGAGWGNFAKSYLNNFSELDWFSFSFHSHFFLSQVASELGILGLIALLPLALFILGKLSFKMNAESSVIYSAIMIILMYSCSEFPLWYLSYLSIFVVFLSLLDTDGLQININFKKVFFLMSIILVIVTSFYIHSYLILHKKIGELISATELTTAELNQLYNEIPNSFGFTKFKDVILLHNLPMDKQSLDVKLKIADRTVATQVSVQSLFKYGQLLSLDGQSEKALTLFKASCSLNGYVECNEVDKSLNKWSLQHEESKGIYQAFKHWRLQNPEKTKWTK